VILLFLGSPSISGLNFVLLFSCMWAG